MSITIVIRRLTCVDVDHVDSKWELKGRRKNKIEVRRPGRPLEL